MKIHHAFLQGSFSQQQGQKWMVMLQRARDVQHLHCYVTLQAVKMRGALSLHQGPTVFPKQVSKYICHRYVCVQLGREMKQELLGTEDHCMLLLKCNATSAPCCMSLSDLYDQKSLLEPRGRLTTCSCLRCCRVTAPQQWEICVCVILLVFFPPLLICLGLSTESRTTQGRCWRLGSARQVKLKPVHICLCFLLSVLGLTWPHRGSWSKRQSGKQPLICIYLFLQRASQETVCLILQT